MIKLQDSNIIDILPEAFTSDPKNIALGYALQGAMRRLLEYSRTIKSFCESIYDANLRMVDISP